MGTDLEIRTNQKNHLKVLLKIKRENKDVKIKELQEAIDEAMVVMEQEDIAWVEKIMKTSTRDS